MVELPQTTANLTESATCLYECIKGANLIAYEDDALRLAVHRAVAIETPRGWRIAKEKQSHRIDVVVALAFAALGAVNEGQPGESLGIIARNLSPTPLRVGLNLTSEDPLAAAAESFDYSNEKQLWRIKGERPPWPSDDF
jgi:hypothetical protein